MVREIRLARVRTGLMLSGSYEYTKETNFHIEVQGQDQAEIHIPMASLSAAIRANPEGTFKPEVRAIVLWDDSFTNPVRWAGPIVTVTPTWEKSELVIGAQGISYTLARIPAISTDDRAGNNDVNRKWVVSGTSYQQLVNHIIASSTSETSDGIKLPQSFGDISWAAGDLSKTIPLVNPPTSVWDVIDSIRTSPAGVETVFVPQLTDSTHVGWVPVVATKANPHYRKDTSLGTVDLSDSTRGTKGFNYTNDSGQRSASWFFGSSNASVKGNDNYTDLTGKWVTAPSGDVEFMHTFSGETYDSELTSAELNTQISARTQDSGTDYKNYELAVFDETFQYTNHLGKSLVTTDSGRMNGLSESIRITAVDWNISDPSSVDITVLPKNLTIFPRVPRHDGDDKDTKNPGKSGPGTTGTTPKTPSSKPEITTPSPLLAGTKGQPYTASIMATGMPTPTFALKTGDELPLGLSLSKTGQITGTPSYQSDTSGNQFTIVATNKNGTDSKLFTLVIGASTAGPTVPPGYTGDGASYQLIDSRGTVSLSALTPFGMHVAKRNNQVFFPASDWLILGTANLSSTWPDLPFKMVQLTGTGMLTSSKTSAGILPSSLIALLISRVSASTVGSWAKQSVALCFTPYIVGAYFFVHVGIYASYGASFAFNTNGSNSTSGPIIKAEKFSATMFRASLADDGTIGTSWTEIAAPKTGDGKWLQPLSDAIVVHGPAGQHVTFAGGIALVDWQMDAAGTTAPTIRPELTWEHQTADHSSGSPIWSSLSVPPPFLSEPKQTGGPANTISTYVDSAGYLYESIGSNFTIDNTNPNNLSVYRCNGMTAAFSGWEQIAVSGPQLAQTTSSLQKHVGRVGDFLLVGGVAIVPGVGSSGVNYFAEKKLSISGTATGKEGLGLQTASRDVPYLASWQRTRPSGTTPPLSFDYVGYWYFGNFTRTAITNFSQVTITNFTSVNYGKWLVIGRTIYQGTTSGDDSSLSFVKFSTDGQ